MAFHARRTLVIAAGKADNSEADDSHKTSLHARKLFSFDLQPVVSSFTDTLPLRRSCRLPFASLSAASNKRESKAGV